MYSLRQPAVAGVFYPDKADELDAAVRGYLAGVAPFDEPAPKAIIAPHAGYVYSGAVAASAYARVLALAGTVKRVVLLGPCHRVAVRGLAIPGVDAFATPLGNVPIDKEACRIALGFPQVSVFDGSHAGEHSLEVHLPFLQVVLGDFSLAPLAVGEASADEVAQVIEALWGGPETLIVISTDLSHFLDYAAARRLDAVTCKAIGDLNPEGIGREQACGRIPVKGMLKVARRRGMKIAAVDVRNSGDTAGDKRRVVGYGSWVLTENAAAAGGSDFAACAKALLTAHGATLLRLAAASIEHGLIHGRPLAVRSRDYAKDLGGPGACFVTLYRGGRLRGCIGSPEARRPLFEDVAQNAFAAAFSDPRFPKLTTEEIEGLELSVSVLSAQTPMSFANEADLLSQLRPGVDGLVIEDQGKRALFLPSVWGQLPKPEAFLGHLKVKAGLAAGHWSDGFRAWRFTASEAKAAQLDDPRSIWMKGEAS